MVKYRQCNMTAGEIDPLLIARNDIDVYYKGLDKARNVVCLPEGGVQRRPGTFFVDKVFNELVYFAGLINITAPNGGIGANANDNDDNTTLATTVAINNTNPYVVVHYDLGAPTFVAFADVRNASITGGAAFSTFAIQASTDDVNWVNIGDQILMSTLPTFERRRVNDTYRYFRFAKVGAANLGANTATIGEFNIFVENATIANHTIVPFKISSDEEYMVMFSGGPGADTGNIAIYQDRLIKANISTQTYQSTVGIGAFQPPTDWASFGSSLLCLSALTPEQVPCILTRKNSPDVPFISSSYWRFDQVQFNNIPYHNFTPQNSNPAQTLTPSALSGEVTLTAGGGVVFAGTDVGNYVDGGGGRARITAFTSATVVTAVTVIPFYTINAMPAGSWTFEQGYEPAWSATRGYPSTATFHQDRLWLAGSSQRSNTIYGSVIKDYFNFDIGNVRDTDAIETTNNNVANVVKLTSHKSLVAFTTEEELSALIQRGQALVPSNSFFVPQTDIGSVPNLQPVISNSSIIFVKGNSSSLAQLNFSELEQSFTSENISVFSSHLIGRANDGTSVITDFALRKSTSAQETDWLLVVNQDGTMAVGSLMTEQNIKGFCLWEFENGAVSSVGVSGNDIYVIISRTIQGNVVLYLEVFDKTAYMDCAVSRDMGGNALIDRIEFLNGQTLRCIGDGLVLQDQTVINGQITLDQDVDGTAQVGINFNTRVRTLPIEQMTVVGEQLGKKRRISAANLVLYNTSQVLVNGAEISLRDPGPIILGQPLPVFTGRKRIQGIRGWDEYGQVELTQTDPLPMTVLAIGLEVDY